MRRRASLRSAPSRCGHRSALRARSCPRSVNHWLPAASTPLRASVSASLSRSHSRACSQVSVQATRCAPFSSPVSSRSSFRSATVRFGESGTLRAYYGPISSPSESPAVGEVCRMTPARARPRGKATAVLARAGRFCSCSSPCGALGGLRWLWIETGWTRPFLVNDTHDAAPARHRRRSSSSRRRSGPLLIDLSSTMRSSRPRRPRSASRSARGRFPARCGHRALRDAAARTHAVRRRLADDSDPRDRADRRRRARQRVDRRLDARGLDAGLRDRCVPHVLSGDRQHPARTAVGRSGSARAHGVVRGERVGRVLEAPCALRASVPLLRVQGGRDGERRGRFIGELPPRSRTASVGRSSTSTSTTS